MLFRSRAAKLPNRRANGGSDIDILNSSVIVHFEFLILGAFSIALARVVQQRAGISRGSPACGGSKSRTSCWEYNRSVETEDLKLLLSLQPVWTIESSADGFQTCLASDMEVRDQTLRYGKSVRTIVDFRWLTPNVARLTVRPRYRSQTETIKIGRAHV